MKHTFILTCAALALISTAAFARPPFFINRAPPELVSTSPASGDSGVPVGVAIRLTFSKPVQPGPGGGFDINWPGGQIIVSSINANQSTFNGPNVYLHPPGGLRPHTVYWVTWPQGAVVDSAGNPDIGNGSGTLLRFRTGP